MHKLPDTVKMKRLLLRFIKWQSSDGEELRRIQKQAARILGLDDEELASLRRRNRG